jgi:flagellar capping protein FliD
MSLYSFENFKKYGTSFLPTGGKDLKKAIKKGKDVVGLLGSSKAPEGYYQSGTTTRDRGSRGTPQQFAIYTKLPTPKAPKPAPAPQQPQQSAPTQQPTGFNPTPLDTGATPEPVQQQGPDFEAMLNAQIESMQQMFAESINQQMMQQQAMQQAQDERMAALQNQMQNQMMAMQQRPQTVGVEMATGAAGTPMQIARRGVTGAFGRRGMRISSLNV